MEAPFNFSNDREAEEDVFIVKQQVATERTPTRQPRNDLLAASQHSDRLRNLPGAATHVVAETNGVPARGLQSSKAPESRDMPRTPRMPRTHRMPRTETGTDLLTPLSPQLDTSKLRKKAVKTMHSPPTRQALQRNENSNHHRGNIMMSSTARFDPPSSNGKK